MRNGFRSLSAALFAAACLVFAGCTTVYQPSGMTGGYKDTRLTDNSYIVEFGGNGNTSKDTVWGFWIYRCAELTQQKGFSYFTVLPKAKTGQNTDNELRFASNDADAGQDWMELRGGGAPTFIWVPGGGGTITTWKSSGTVLMFKDSTEAGAQYALRASSVLEALKPLVVSQGRSGHLSSEELVKRAMVLPLPMAEVKPPVVPWSGGSGGRVEMRDLGALLPK